MITNALGSFPQARVDLLGLKLRPGDTFLLCTDGLSGVLEERALKEVLAHFPPPRRRSASWPWPTSGAARTT